MKTRLNRSSGIPVPPKAHRVATDVRILESKVSYRFPELFYQGRF